MIRLVLKHDVTAVVGIRAPAKQIFLRIGIGNGRNIENGCDVKKSGVVANHEARASLDQFKELGNRSFSDKVDQMGIGIQGLRFRGWDSR